MKAFRDTWRDGIHSYMTHLRDRLTVARDLLADSGSIFVQIGDENVHRVRALMDEVFGEENFVAQVSFRKKLMPLGAKTLESMADYLVWFARNLNHIKYRQIYQATVPNPVGRWTGVREANGHLRRLTSTERRNLASIADDSEIFGTVSQWAPSFSETSVYPFLFRGSQYTPRIEVVLGKRHLEGMRSPRTKLGRLGYPTLNSTLLCSLSLDDFPYEPHYGSCGQILRQPAFTDDKTYVVETNRLKVHRTLHPNDHRSWRPHFRPNLRLWYHRLRCRAVGTPLDNHRHFPRRSCTRPRPHNGSPLSLLILIADSRDGTESSRQKSSAAPPRNPRQMDDDVRQGFVYDASSSYHADGQSPTIRRST